MYHAFGVLGGVCFDGFGREFALVLWEEEFC